MTGAANLLAQLDRLGVELLVDGEQLRYRPIEAVPAPLLSWMRSHKTELLAALRDPTGATLGTPGYWARQAAAALSGIADAEQRVSFRELFEERAAFIEFEAGYHRNVAEQRAFHEIEAVIQASEGPI